MSLDYRQVQKQIREMGENALLREQLLLSDREKARVLLNSYREDFDRLQQKVQLIARAYDPTLRCALPTAEPLDAGFPLPPLPSQVAIIAADGSQIAPDRNAEVNYCLVNVGAIQMLLGVPVPPVLFVESQLMYDEQLYTETGTITEDAVALARDLSERVILSRLAAQAPSPVVTFTDGPMELWGAKDADGAAEFRKKLDAYLEALESLCSLGAVTAGYVDKPAANMVVRLLEIAMLEEVDFPDARKLRPLRRVTDQDLYRYLLQPGERSAVFAIQSKSASNYKEELELHFFYLNVGRPGRPWLARVEVPAWVVSTTGMLDMLHAVLVQQAQVMGSRPYPYLLHRAHEAAVVTLEEKQQVTDMILLELRRRGVEVGEISQKQAAKNLPGKTRYTT